MEVTSQPSFSQSSYLKPQETVPRSSDSLHSTRKQPTKPWKRPVTASPQRMHPRVYRVEPVNFKELVQRLTGASQELEPDQVVHHFEAKPIKISDDITIANENNNNNNNPFVFDLSPSSSRFWEAFPLLSPTNLSRW